jgi:ATP-binding cassette subfamily F protein 3
LEKTINLIEWRKIKMSLLTLENITKEYPSNSLLRGVNLRVEKGDRLALIGHNGCGKSTLLKIAMGLETQDSGSVVIARNIKVGYLSQGINSIKLDGEFSNNTILHHEKIAKIEKRLRELEAEMSLIKNNEATEKQQRLLSEYSSLTSKFESMDGYNFESKMKKTLLGLGLRKEVLSIPLHKLSGGEKVRTAMAKILLEEPDLLILDEPTNHLDIMAMEWLEDLLKKFEGGVLLVSHDRYFLDAITTRIAELDQGTLIEKNSSFSVFLDQKQQMLNYTLKEEKRLRQETKNTNKLIQELRNKGKIKASMSREKVYGKKNQQYKTKLQELRDKEHLHDNLGPQLTFKNIKHVSKDIAWAENLTKYFADLCLFKNVNFHIRGGEKIAIIGSNGCGKTTLINLLLGKDKNYSGFIRLGEWVKYSYMGQEVYFEDESKTMLQEVIVEGTEEKEGRDILAKFQFYGDDIYKKISVLSGGERIKLHLAKILLQQPDCLIMDEPTNHLDTNSREAVERALKEFKGTVISISHDRYFLTHCTTRILELTDGSLISYEGNYEYYKAVKSFNEETPLKSINNTTKTSSSNVKADKEYCRKNKRDAINPDKIEIEIIEAERKVRAMEETFNSSTPPEVYVEYDNLISTIGKLYDLWESLTG